MSSIQLPASSSSIIKHLDKPLSFNREPLKNNFSSTAQKNPSSQKGYFSTKQIVAGAVWSLAAGFLLYDKFDKTQVGDALSPYILDNKTFSPENCESLDFKLQTVFLNTFYDGVAGASEALFRYADEGNFKALECLLNQSSDLSEDALNLALSKVLYRIKDSSNNHLIDLLIKKGANPNLEFSVGVEKKWSPTEDELCSYVDGIFWPEHHCIMKTVISPLKTAVRIGDLNLFEELVAKGVNEAQISMMVDKLSSALKAKERQINCEKTARYLDILFNSGRVNCDLIEKCHHNFGFKSAEEYKLKLKEDLNFLTQGETCWKMTPEEKAVSEKMREMSNKSFENPRCPYKCQTFSIRRANSESQLIANYKEDICLSEGASKDEIEAKCTELSTYSFGRLNGGVCIDRAVEKAKEACEYLLLNYNSFEISLI